MALNAREKNSNRSPVVISLKVNYESLQRQIEEAAKSMTADQVISFLLLIVGLSLIAEILPKTEQEAEQDENSLAWSYLLELQKEVHDSQAVGDLLANIQLVVNDKPIELHMPSTSPDDELGDPFESFKRGWDDAMHGRTISREEFRRRMLEDGD